MISPILEKKWLSPAYRKRTKLPRLSISNIEQLAPIKSLKNEDFLRQKYLEEGLSLQEIAAETVSSWKTVRRHIAYQKIPLRPQDSLLSRKNTSFGTVIIDGNRAVNDLETKAISYIKLLRNEGRTYRQIVAKLNKENIPARKSGAKWHLKTVFKVLEKSG